MLIGFILVLLNFFGFLQLSNFLPTTEKANAVESNIEGQTIFKSIRSDSITIRNSLLWLDANNFGYGLATLFLFSLYFFFYEDKIRTKSKYRYYLQYLIMFVFLISIIFTLSRGAILSLVLSSIFVFLFFKDVSKKKRKFLVISSIIFLITFTALPTVSEKLLELSDRISLGLGLFGYSKTNTVLTGLETTRLEVAKKAFFEFLDKPIFGWGGGDMGVISGTSNHAYYINFLAQWGLVGFSIYLFLYFIIISKVLKSLKVANYLNSSTHGLGILLLGLFITIIIKGFFADGTILFSGGLLIAYCNSVYQLRNQSNSILKNHN